MCSGSCPAHPVEREEVKEEEGEEDGVGGKEEGGQDVKEGEEWWGTKTCCQFKEDISHSARQTVGRLLACYQRQQVRLASRVTAAEITTWWCRKKDSLLAFVSS